MNNFVNTDWHGGFDDLDLGSARGGRRAGRKPKVVVVSVVRELTEADLPAITNPPVIARKTKPLIKLRHTHHRVAELLAQGTAPLEISRITGYTVVTISNLRNHDPGFMELVAHYEGKKHQVFIDALERLRAVGIDATEKLREMLHDPKKFKRLARKDLEWSLREVMELVELAVVKPATAKSGLVAPAAGQGNAANLSLEVRFVGTRPADGPVVDAVFSETTKTDMPPVLHHEDTAA